MPSPDSILSSLLIIGGAAPLVQAIIVRWFTGMALHHRQILNQVSFLCMGLALGALASRHDWGTRWPGETVLAIILGVSLFSALSLLGRPDVRIGGWSTPFTLGLAGCAGFFGAEGAWAPAALIGAALLADLAWAVFGRFAWEIENRAFHGPTIHLNVAGSGIVVADGTMAGTGGSELPRQVHGTASGMASTAVAKAMSPKVPTDTFAQLIGMDDTKQALARALQRALDEPETRNGILLFGPPGNGKTRLVRAACGELGAPMVEMAIADLVSPHHGQGPRALADAFDQACRAPGHTVLFLDEIDAVLTRRGDQAALLGDAALLTQVFLTKVSEARERGLVVVGATNFMERLDPAAIREGRFDHRLEIPHPTAETRRRILERQLPRLAGAEREVAVQRLNGFSIARLMALAERTSERFMQGRLAWEHVAAGLRELQGTSGQSLDGVPTLASLVFNQETHQHLTDLRNRIAQSGAVIAAGGTPPSGALFSGPTGTGKTFAAKALAKELGLAFFPTTGYDLVHQEGAMERLFHQAAETRPSLVFLDEAEDLLGTRQAGSAGMAAGLSGKLLAWLDGANGRPMDVMVVAATNHPEWVDPAFLRPGRLTEHVVFSAPDEYILTQLCEQALSARSLLIDPAVTPQQMARILLGATPAMVGPALDQALSDSLARASPLLPGDIERAAKRMGLCAGTHV